MTERQINAGIIGLGHIGKYHIAAIRQFQEIRLLAVCDRQEKYSKLAPEGVDFYSDYQQILADERIETVIIATPNNTHYLLAMNALYAGKNIILEKPAAESMSEIGQLEKTAGSSGLDIYYAFHAAMAYDVEWFIGHYAKMKDELGPVTGFISHFYDPYISRGVLSSEAEGLKDCWLDSGINAISVLQRIIGLDMMRVEHVSSAINHGKKPGLLQCSAEFSFPVEEDDFSGIGVVDTNWATGRNHKSTLIQFGRSGCCIILDHSLQKVLRRRRAGNDRELADLSKGRDRLLLHYLGVFRDYLKCCRSGDMNLAQSVAAHKLVFDVKEKINETV